jgi:hypothetical protein
VLGAPPLYNMFFVSKNGSTKDLKWPHPNSQNNSKNEYNDKNKKVCFDPHLNA